MVLGGAEVTRAEPLRMGLVALKRDPRELPATPAVREHKPGHRPSVDTQRCLRLGVTLSASRM